MFLSLSPENWSTIGAVVGILVASIGLITFIIRSIFRLGKFSQRLQNVEESANSIKGELQQTRKELTDRIDSLISITIQSGLSEAHSPRQLTAEGKKVLANSGIAAVVDDKIDLIVKKVHALKPENAYQAQQAVLDVVEALVDDPETKDIVENGAFQSGYPVSAVLYVGGIYIRDKVLQKLNFLPADIDKHAPDPKK